jgi:hypothetical protein
MAQFNQTVSELKVAFADTLFESLKPLLEVLQTFMSVLKDNAPLRNVIVIGGLLATTLAALYAVYLMLSSAIRMQTTMTELNLFMQGKAIPVHAAHKLSVMGLSVSYTTLAMSIGKAMAGLAIGYTLLSAFNGPAKIAVGAIMAIVAALVTLWAMQSATSSGLALISGGVAAAGAIGVAQGVIESVPKYAGGTPYVPRTGPAILHEGERVLTKEQNQSYQSGKSNSQSISIDMSGMTLQTKMDKEEFIPFIKRELRNIVTGK